MSDNAKPNVWGLHNGNAGDQLPALTHIEGPFPPQEGSAGWIAIGWPAIGDMKMWTGDYKTYFQKFQIIYPDYANKRVTATQANIPWYFAFDMMIGDWVICPCSSEGVLLVGQVSGGYEATWEGTPGLRADFIHFRSVRWLHVILRNDPRFGKLNRIGQLTLSRQNLSVQQLRSILNGERSEAA
jgi:restriction system protein